jgi:pantoate--beta-alanine ligase
MPKPPASLRTLRTIAALRRAVAQWHGDGLEVALVPTMGALHRGHLALVARARRAADRVVVSLFVNPAQFAPGEDFTRYPRDERRDRAMLRDAGADLLYAPGLAEIYPPGFATSIAVAGLGERLEGAHRPGHFNGVATIVAKLLIETRADAACFGEKDYQQLQLVRRLVRDLDIATRIIGVPTAREPDGLALSSRNAYLSAAEREAAPALHRVLVETGRRVQQGMPIAEGLMLGTRDLLASGFGAVDYVAIADAETLETLETLDREARILGAAMIGRTRLIDNVRLRPISPGTAPDNGRPRHGRRPRAGSSR